MFNYRELHHYKENIMSLRFASTFGHLSILQVSFQSRLVDNVWVSRQPQTTKMNLKLNSASSKSCYYLIGMLGMRGALKINGTRQETSTMWRVIRMLDWKWLIASTILTCCKYNLILVCSSTFTEKQLSRTNNSWAKLIFIQID